MSQRRLDGLPIENRPRPDASPARPRSRLGIWVTAAVLAWSLLAWSGYILVDPLLTWLASSAGLLVESGKDVATAMGAKEFVPIADTIGIGGLLGQFISLLQLVLKPAIVVVWAIGALLLMATGLLFPRLRELIACRR